MGCATFFVAVAGVERDVAFAGDLARGFALFVDDFFTAGLLTGFFATGFWAGFFTATFFAGATFFATGFFAGADFFAAGLDFAGAVFFTVFFVAMVRSPTLNCPIEERLFAQITRKLKRFSYSCTGIVGALLASGPKFK